MRTSWWTAAFGVVVGLLAAGLLVLVGRSPRGVPIELTPAPTQAPLQVYVSGAVTRPGVYSMPTGSRVQDVLQAAGGLLVGADLQDLNLAAPVRDGMRLHIPTPAPTSAPGATPDSQVATPDEPTSTPAFPININTASQEDLESLPRIGPVIAQRILDYRERNGPFTSIQAIQYVSGIGPATFEAIKDLITVDELP